jgi:acetolactate synthase-1/2/3 large subunit
VKKGSDLLVAALENEGVDRIFGVPGEENLDVIESPRRHHWSRGKDKSFAC